ncbi:I78 family peptidase inhibitor [Paracoccaceae bacterium Fryx2]|nr:I78 family peptidase inhibitor [Paracoccaceae bacterium Fryx2]
MRLVLVLVLSLAACTAAPLLPPPPSTVPLAPCGADRLQGLLGQPAPTLTRRVQPGITLRLIRPGDAVTEDFSLSRLNAQLDGRGRLLALYCG